MDGDPPATGNIRDGSPPRRLGHSPALDGVRGIAVVLVLAVNSLLPWFPGGFAGVDLFFVLSGFLITTLLTEEWARTGRIDVRCFLARRALRLLPALFVLVGVCCAYAAWRQAPEAAAATWREAVWVLGYVANWPLTRLHAVGPLDHAWSLAVEEQFYLTWPFVFAVMLGAGRSRGFMLGGLMVAALAAALWRAWLFAGGVHHLRLYYGTDTRADALLIGCAAGLLYARGGRPAGGAGRVLIRGLAAAAPVLFGGVLFFIPTDAPVMYLGGFTLLALAGAAVVIEVAAEPRRGAARLLASPALAWLGRISYSLYLWHYPVFHALRVERFADAGWPPVLVHALRFGAVFAAAGASYYLVERPCLRLKHRLRPSPTSAAVPGACGQPD